MRTPVNEPLFLTLDEVLQLHAESLEHFGGDEGIRDIGLIESAIATPRQGFGGQSLHPSPPSLCAWRFRVHDLEEALGQYL